MSEPSRREKEPERGSFGAKQNGFIGNYKKKRERKREREIDRSVSKEFVAVRTHHDGKVVSYLLDVMLSRISFVNSVSRGTRANFRFPNGKSLMGDRVDGESDSN